MKGFKDKKGKFHPTGSHSGLKKSDIRKKKTLPSPKYEQGSDMLTMAGNMKHFDFEKAQPNEFQNQSHNARLMDSSMKIGELKPIEPAHQVGLGMRKHRGKESLEDELSRLQKERKEIHAKEKGNYPYSKSNLDRLDEINYRTAHIGTEMDNRGK